MEPATIALFVYKRPEHAQRVIESLKQNTLSVKSKLVIFSDEAKNEFAEKGVDSVRKYIKSVKGFKSIEIIERRENYGLSKSLISGVSETLQNTDRIIVLEDDILVSPFFLDYMNTALDFYENHEKVISIHAYNYPIQGKLPEAFFLKGADCWGWATWKRGWDLFESDGQKMLKEIKSKNLTYEFDFYGSYPYTKMLKNQVKGKNDSWAILWYASAFLKDKLTFYPGRSIIENIGLDGTGTHCGTDSLFSSIDSLEHTKNVNYNLIDIVENLEIKKSIADYFRSTSKNSFIDKIIRKLR